MAEVIVAFRVLPKGVEIDLNDLEKKIRSSVKPERISHEPIAFGLVALHVVKIIRDAEGELEKIEKKLKEIEEVSEIEVIGITRSL